MQRCRPAERKNATNWQLACPMKDQVCCAHLEPWPADRGAAQGNLLQQSQGQAAQLCQARALPVNLSALVPDAQPHGDVHQDVLLVHRLRAANFEGLGLYHSHGIYPRHMTFSMTGLADRI